MKKLIKTLSLIVALLLALSLLGAFVSCNAEIPDEEAHDIIDNTEKPIEKPTDKPTDKPTETPTEAPTEAPPADPPVEISVEMQSEIKNKYFEETYEEKNKEYYNSPEQVKIEACYGIFDDAYCIVITYPTVDDYLTVAVDVEVGEYTFIFGYSGIMIDVYCNGEFYGLEQAYEKGILDDAELESLYNYYMKTRGW